MKPKPRTNWKKARIEDGFIKIKLEPLEKDHKVHKVQFVIREKNGEIQWRIIDHT